MDGAGVAAIPSSGQEVVITQLIHRKALQLKRFPVNSREVSSVSASGVVTHHAYAGGRRVKRGRIDVATALASGRGSAGCLPVEGPSRNRLGITSARPVN